MGTRHMRTRHMGTEDAARSRRAAASCSAIRPTEPRRHRKTDASKADVLKGCGGRGRGGKKPPVFFSPDAKILFAGVAGQKPGKGNSPSSVRRQEKDGGREQGQGRGAGSWQAGSPIRIRGFHTEPGHGTDCRWRWRLPLLVPPGKRGRGVTGHAPPALPRPLASPLMATPPRTDHVHHRPRPLIASPLAGHAPTHWPRPPGHAPPATPPLTGHAPAHWPRPSPATPLLIGLAPCRPRPHSPATPPSQERQGPAAPSPGRGELATASRIRKRRWRIPWASVRSRDNMRERVTAPIRGEAGARLQTGRAATLRGCLGRGFGAASQPRYLNWRFAKGAPAPGGLGAPKRL